MGNEKKRKERSARYGEADHVESRGCTTTPPRKRFDMTSAKQKVPLYSILHSIFQQILLALRCNCCREVRATYFLAVSTRFRRLGMLFFPSARCEGTTSPASPTIAFPLQQGCIRQRKYVDRSSLLSRPRQACRVNCPTIYRLCDPLGTLCRVAVQPVPSCLTSSRLCTILLS